MFLKSLTPIFLTLFLLVISIQGPSAWAAKPPGGHLNITEVLVTFGPPDTLTITGEDFDFGPGPLVVTFGDLGPLDIVSATATEIVVKCPLTLTGYMCPEGDRLLTVSMGNGQSQNDEYDLTIGAVGPQGPQGDKGDKGDQGDKGDKGDKGDTGEQGIQGVKGDTGEQGIQGMKGDTGEQGIQGMKGDKGDQGEQGPQGPAGPPGEPAAVEQRVGGGVFGGAEIVAMFGDNFPGDSTIEGFEGGHSVVALGFGLTASTDGSGTVRATPFDVQLQLDSNPLILPLQLAAAQGTVIPEVKVFLIRRDAGEPAPFLVLELENVFINSVNLTGSGDPTSRPAVQIALNYGKVIFTVTPRQADGTPGAEITAAWDVVRNDVNGCTLPDPLKYATPINPDEGQQFEFLSSSLGFSSVVDSTGSGAGRTTFQTVNVTRDIASELAISPCLFGAAANGQLLNAVEINRFTRDETGELFGLASRMRLEDAFITSYTLSGNSETVKFAYSKIIWTEEVKDGPRTTIRWDVIKNEQF